MIRALTLVIVALLAQQTQPREAVTQTGTASISGVVIAAADKQPVGYARVTLNNDTRITYTNAKGEFLFPKLPQARYTVVVQASGFLPAVLGQTRPGRPGVTQVLADGEERKGIVISLHKGGLIAGHVVGPNNRPLADVTVWTLRKTWSQDGLAVWGLAGKGKTDDRGDYRIPGLREGKYLVEVLPQSVYGSERIPDPEGIQRLAAEGMIPTFYPGTTDPAASVEVAIDLDAERAGVDFNLQPTTMRMVSGRIEGFVFIPGLPERLLSAGSVRMVPVSQPAGGVLENNSGLEQFSRVNADGRFRLEAVPPGQYELRYQGRASSTQTAHGSTTVAVGDRDVEDIMVIARPAATVSGALIAATGANTAIGVPSLGVIPIGGERGPYNNFPLARVDGPSAFSFTNLEPGRYALRTSAQGPRVYVSKLEIDGAPAQGTLIEIGAVDVTTVRVTYNTDLAEVSGYVRHEDQTPVTEYTLVIFPADKREWPVWMSGAGVARADSSGRYSYSVKPGSYLIAAVEDVETNQWLDPAFLQSLMPSATKITLGPLQKLTQDFLVK